MIPFVLKKTLYGVVNRIENSLCISIFTVQSHVLVKFKIIYYCLTGLFTLRLKLVIKFFITTRLHSLDHSGLSAVVPS